MENVTLREMQPGDRSEVASLIFLSTNFWYQVNRKVSAFSGDPSVTELFFDVYSALEGSSGLVALEPVNGQLMGSCFYHIRPTHVALGIMNVHPNYFGRRVARSLLDAIIEIADREEKPLRLVSSAMNLDSFSLYNRAGFVPRRVYQDMILAVPEDGLRIHTDSMDKVRPATLDDIAEIAELEMSVSHLRREGDYRYFITNSEGFWHASVFEAKGGQIAGFLASCGHPGCNMVGPGFCRTTEQAAALLLTELDRHRGRTPVFLVPSEFPALVQAAYSWGARNCELHFSQVRGPFEPFSGVTLPSFMPESA